MYSLLESRTYRFKVQYTVSTGWLASSCYKTRLTYHAEEQLLKVHRVALTADELDQLVDMTLKDGEVGDLCAHKARADQSALVRPDIVVCGKNALAEQWGGTLASQRAHAKVLELKSQNGLDDARVAGVDGRAEVGVGGEGQAILRMTLLEQSQEAELAGGSKVGEDDICSHEGVLLLELDGGKTAMVSTDTATSLPPLEQSGGCVEDIAKEGQAAR